MICSHCEKQRAELVNGHCIDCMDAELQHAAEAIRDARHEAALDALDAAEAQPEAVKYGLLTEADVRELERRISKTRTRGVAFAA